MIGSANATGERSQDRFAWHPDYRDRTVQEVRDELRRDLEHDQRAYALAMEGAEEQEHAVLATVMELDKRWGSFDLDWAMADATDLAARIATFEKARDNKREMFSYDTYRPLGSATQGPSESSRPWWRRLFGG